MSLVGIILLGTLISVPVNMAVNAVTPEKFLVCEQADHNKMVCHWEKK